MWSLMQMRWVHLLGLANTSSRRHECIRWSLLLDYLVFPKLDEGKWIRDLNFSAITGSPLINAKKKLEKSRSYLFALKFLGFESASTKFGRVIRAADAFVWNIDHHQDPEDFCGFRSGVPKQRLLWAGPMKRICRPGRIKELKSNKGIAWVPLRRYYELILEGFFRHPNTTKNVHLVVQNYWKLEADTLTDS